MIAKQKAYGFSGEALKFMQSYLKSRKQRVQMNNKFSSERVVIAGAPQGSIDKPLFINLRNQSKTLDTCPKSCQIVSYCSPYLQVNPLN